MKSIAPLAGPLLVALVGGCAPMNDQPVATAGQVKQIITCFVNNDADPAQVLGSANALSKLPEVLDVSAGYTPDLEASSGKTAVGPRNVLLIMTFKNESNFDAALHSDRYKEIVDREIRPKCKSVTTYSTTLENYLVAEKYTEESTAAALQRRAAAIKQQNELRGHTK